MNALKKSREEGERKNEIAIKSFTTMNEHEIEKNQKRKRVREKQRNEKEKECWCAFRHEEILGWRTTCLSNYLSKPVFRSSKSGKIVTGANYKIMFKFLRVFFSNFFWNIPSFLLN